MSSNQMKETVVNYLSNCLNGYSFNYFVPQFSLLYKKDNSSIFFIGLFTDKVR